VCLMVCIRVWGEREGFIGPVVSRAICVCSAPRCYFRASIWGHKYYNAIIQTKKKLCKRVSRPFLQDPDQPYKTTTPQSACVHIHVDTRNVYQVHQIINPLTHVNLAHLRKFILRYQPNDRLHNSFMQIFFCGPTDQIGTYVPSLKFQDHTQLDTNPVRLL